MINITNKIDCCGCQACGDICGKNAISFQTDDEGIWYPEVDRDKCVDCGLCEKVCPIINRMSCPTNAKVPECIVLQAPDAYDRLQSASGAAYTLLVRAIFEKGGYVAGHIWDERFGVKGYITGKPEDLEILRGTKYLQSNVEGLYVAVRKLLNEGKMILFSGTPCQNAAMRSFLKKDYDNLIMTDFVCMGIDSPLAFKKYLESLETKYHSKIVYFKAKSKEVGWRYLTNKAVFENGFTYFGINGRDANLKATFLDVLVRPSCYDCKFKGFPRVSDITIGDYWRKKYDFDSLDDNSGTSYIMIHNKKAATLVEDVKQKCYYRTIDFHKIIEANQKAVESLPQPFFDRTEVYKRLQNEDFLSLVDEYSILKERRKSLVRKIRAQLRKVLNVLHFYKDRPFGIFTFIYYNFLNSRVQTNFLNGDCLLLKNTKLDVRKGASIEVKGICVIDGGDLKTQINLGDKSNLSLDNNAIHEGVTIIANNSASIKLGFKTIVNKQVKLHAITGISIEDFCLICDHVIIDETNQGILYFNEINKANKKIIIGTHVLLNRGCVIKAGTHLHDETIVREYSIVEGSFEPHVVLGGNPAIIIDNSINWKVNFENIWNFKN